MRLLHWPPREPFSGLSHGIGVLLSTLGLLVLLISAWGRPWHTLAFAIYGATLILLYTASSLYHSLDVSERGLERLQRCDHIAIFLLIAGTYTPVCLVSLHGLLGWSLLGAAYTLALTGIGLVLLWRNAPNWIRLVLYVAMGWLAALAWGPLRQSLTPVGMGWLVAGGLVYTFGTIFYVLDTRRIVGKITGHDIWHLFVMGGSVCHFVVMLLFVAHFPTR